MSDGGSEERVHGQDETHGLGVYCVLCTTLRNMTHGVSFKSWKFMQVSLNHLAEERNGGRTKRNDLMRTKASRYKTVLWDWNFGNGGSRFRCRRFHVFLQRESQEYKHK